MVLNFAWLIFSRTLFSLDFDFFIFLQVAKFESCQNKWQQKIGFQTIAIVGTMANNNRSV